MTGEVSAVLMEALRTLRELQLHLNFFNLSFASVLWGMKVCWLSCTILAGFSAIRLIHTNPTFGCLYAYICVACVMIYIGLFQSAYKVTEKLEELTKLMETMSGGLVNPEERKYWARVLKSVPRMGMSLGGFSQVERETVPVFIDFCVNQIVSLLIAFP